MAFEAASADPASATPGTILEAMCAAGLISLEEKPGIEDLLLKSGAALDQALSRLGLATEDALADFYASYYGVPRRKGEGAEPFCDASAQINRRFLERHRIVPLRRTETAVIAAVVDPGDETAMTGLCFALGAPVTAEVITATEFERLFASFSPEDRVAEQVSDIAAIGDDAARLKDLASAEPAVRLVNRLIINASAARASDIHMEPRERDVLVRRRVDGVLTTSEMLTRAQGLSAVSRLKILAGLDIAERRRPQDGRLSFPVAGRPIDMRVSTAPTIHGESVVIRLLEKPVATLGLDALGFAPSKALALKRLIDQPNGIVLITGPTGSGKTTTLYALLEMLARRELKILTIEDPVEYRIDGVSQTQVNPAIGLNFASAMRSFLRHDPDVIMVGEMRDLETARTAVQAALTGHLVLSTLHTNDAPSAVTRLIDMGLDDYLIGSTLLGVVAQRLVRRLCGECRNEPGLRVTCKTCQGGGYAGRLAVCEALEVTDALKTELRRGVTTSQVKLAAVAEGFESMSADSEAKIRAGLTDRAEVIRVLGHDGAAA